MQTVAMEKRPGEETVASHYEKLLGISRPWKVLAAQLDLLRGKVEIEVGWEESAPVTCPECGKACPRHYHAPQREWRHLNVMQFLTIIRARVPRCRCPEHGVLTVRTPWAEPGSHFTVHFENFAVQVIAACRSLTQAADLLELGWDGVQRIVDRAVNRGLVRRSTAGVLYVGLDEKSFGRGQRYVSIATDIKGSRVLKVVPGHDQAAGESLWQALPAEQRSKVEAAAMDMSAGFVAATRVQAPQAAIVHDKFLVAKLLNDAVDQTRRAEHQQLQAKGDDTRDAAGSRRWCCAPAATPGHALPAKSGATSSVPTCDATGARTGSTLPPPRPCAGETGAAGGCATPVPQASHTRAPVASIVDTTEYLL